MRRPSASLAVQACREISAARDSTLQLVRRKLDECGNYSPYANLLGNIHKDGARIYSHPPTTPRWRRPAAHRSTHRFVDDANERIRIGWSVEPRRRGSFRLSADVHAYC